MTHEPLDATLLYTACDPRQLGFATTATATATDGAFGQDRALDALRFGAAIDGPGYNAFVVGEPGTGRHAIVREFLAKQASTRATADDWCYVGNFAEPGRPRLLRLPAGAGRRLRDGMRHLVADLSRSIPAALESDDYQRRVQGLEKTFSERQDEALADVARQANERDVQLIRTPTGFVFAPLLDGHVVTPDEFGKLSEKQQQAYQEATTFLSPLLQSIVRQFPRWHKEFHEQLEVLRGETVEFAVGAHIDHLRDEFQGMAEVAAYLDGLQRDLKQHGDAFRGGEQEHAPEALRALADIEERAIADRYQVNLLVDRTGQQGAPVVYAEHPSYGNLVGRIEHRVALGALVTDFSLIRAGALQRANGGFLIVDALRLLREPFAWDALKRALYGRRVRPESIERAMGLAGTASLEPEPMPLNVRVIMIGEAELYELLSAYDPEFDELFKVVVDFDDVCARTPASERAFAQRIAAAVADEKLRPFAAAAVARTVEHMARVAGDARRLSLNQRRLRDLLREADHWAGQRQATTVEVADVELALHAWTHHRDRLRGRLHERIERGTIAIATSGEHIGQINALSVVQVGEFPFGLPTRVTATSRSGGGDVVDIERQVEFGGAIHSKGVLILSHFVAARYARDMPLSLHASLVFEQSYGPIEGDSASLAETCALLSSLAQVPLRQNLAVTGSIDQLGRVQAVGGVNEKIEGFFDVCARQGLDGTHGVLIPRSNVEHLMLRQDVRDACGNGSFRVYAVATVDEALALLTGVPAGERDIRGAYPADSVNARAEAALRRFERARHPQPARGQARNHDD